MWKLSAKGATDRRTSLDLDGHQRRPSVRRRRSIGWFRVEAARPVDVRRLSFHVLGASRGDIRDLIENTAAARIALSVFMFSGVTR